MSSSQSSLSKLYKSGRIMYLWSLMCECSGTSGQLCSMPQSSLRSAGRREMHPHWWCSPSSCQLLSVGRCSCSVSRHPTHAHQGLHSPTPPPKNLLASVPTNCPTGNAQGICSAVCLFGPQADTAGATQPSNKSDEGRALKGPKTVLKNSTPEKLGESLDMGVLTEGRLGDQVLPHSLLYYVHSHCAVALCNAAAS